MKKNKGENSFVNNFLKILFLVLGVGLQVILLLFLYGATSTLSSYARVVFQLVQFVSVLYIIYKDQNPAYKIVWIILLMFLPVGGFVLYIIWGNNKSPKRIKKVIRNETKKSLSFLPKCDDVINHICNFLRRKEAIFLTNTSKYPIYYSDTVDYFSSGEEYYSRLKNDLKCAKKYILMEYFIISKGKMWDEIYEILCEKRRQGVEVFIIFDSLGSLLKKPKGLKDKLEIIGVNFLSFNPLTPFIRSYINYRDHRKIVVVDGFVAYTGGINIGDEYININSRVGHWKDSGVRITGEAVKSFIVIFFKLWNINKDDFDYENFIRMVDVNGYKKGYVIPFSDQPHNKKNPSEFTYINIINNANNYIYIMTPYLILDSEMQQALINASLAGIDVKIITPFIPDKKLVNACTKSFYSKLLRYGVRIYEYKPGFIHSKSIVSDDTVAVVGTTNFDFRSFYLNYECSLWMHNTGEELEIKKDFENTLKVCNEVKLKIWNKRKLGIRIVEALLRLISPLL